MIDGYELALPGLIYDALLAHLLAKDGNEGAAKRSARPRSWQ